MSALRAQTTAEIRMTLRRGESVLLTLGIPVLLLVFFSAVDVLPLPAGVDDPVDVLAPGMLALAVMSSAMVGTAIATAFERQYLVLKRLGTTPLGRQNLVLAKILAILAVEIVQVIAVIAVGIALGWRPSANGIIAGAAAVVLATSAFTGLGLTMAGRWRAEMTLAGANGIYLVLLLVSGMVIPVEELPSALRAVSRLLPSTALADVFHGALRTGVGVPGRAWIVLFAWAVAAPAMAVRLFRWE